jgi:pilus assembly protein CpaF
MTQRLQVLRDDIPQAWHELGAGAHLIGSHPACDILLEADDVAQEQAQIVLDGEQILLFNLAGGDDVCVNRRPVRSTILEDDDEIQIGRFQLRVSEDDAVIESDLVSVKSTIHQTLIERLDLKKLQVQELSDRELWRRCEVIVSHIIDRMRLPEDVDPERLKREVLDEALGLGPLEELLTDESITEIMVNSKSQIFVEQRGRLSAVPSFFTSDEQLLNIIARIVNPLGRRIDESSPMVDARLMDGSRVNAIIPPLSLQGPMITIRKFSKEMLTEEDLIRFGSLPREMVEFLEAAVKLRKNILISGGTGSGKTTLLNVLSGFIPPGERVLTIEDSAELRLPHQNLGSLEARPPNIEGEGEVTIRDLVRNALRMRPDRIIVGECRGGEAIDMLQAMNTGHDGSLTTVHANSTADAILRLQTMVMMAGFELPVVVIRQQIAAAIELIVQQTRLSDGSRRVVCISEVTGIGESQVDVEDLFVFRETGRKEDGRIEGEFVATGRTPSVMSNALEQGLYDLDAGLFEAGRVLA